jgi:hypothetical protein
VQVVIDSGKLHDLDWFLVGLDEVVFVVSGHQVLGLKEQDGPVLQSERHSAQVPAHTEASEVG